MAYNYYTPTVTVTGATTSPSYTLSSVSSGQVLTTTSSGTSWANGSITQNAVMTVKDDTVVLNDSATLDVKGNVKINGIDLEERLKTIERVLAIPERDATMEAKYPSLKKKFDDYINTLEKYRTFERIKGETE